MELFVRFFAARRSRQDREAEGGGQQGEQGEKEFGGFNLLLKSLSEDVRCPLFSCQSAVSRSSMKNIAKRLH